MEQHRSYYAIIPANIRYDKRIPANAKLLYGEITALCNEKGYCWAGDKYFADLYNVSKTTVQNWLKSLADHNYISKELIYKEGTKEILHRYIKILAYPTQENLHTPTQENLRDNNTLFNNTVNNTKNKKNSVERSSTMSDLFESIWKLYPKKTNKKKAKEQFIKKIRNDSDLERFNKGYNDYLKYITLNDWYHPQELFWWIRDDRFNDEYDLSQPKPTGYQKQSVRQERLPDWVNNPAEEKKLPPEEQARLERELQDLLGE